MSGGHFGSHFADGHFASHFGPTGAVDPNAMRGTAAGVASVTGTLAGLGSGSMVGSAAGSSTVAGNLTSVGAPAVDQRVTGGWLTEEDVKRQRRERRKWKQDQDEIRAALKSILDKVKGKGPEAKPAVEAVKTALKADPAHAAKSVGRVISALGKVSHVPGLLEVQAEARTFQRRVVQMDAERRAMIERHRLEQQDEEDLISLLLTGT